MSGTGDICRSYFRCGSMACRRHTAVYLFIGSQCDSVWKGPNGCNLYGLLFMRHYGYNGGCTPRCRLFVDANDCFSDRCLRPADCVDFYCVSDSQKSLDAVHFLSNYLDYYRWCSYSLLYSCQKKAITDGKESVKIQKLCVYEKKSVHIRK